MRVTLRSVAVLIRTPASGCSYVLLERSRRGDDDPKSCARAARCSAASRSMAAVSSSALPESSGLAAMVSSCFSIATRMTSVTDSPLSLARRLR